MELGYKLPYIGIDRYGFSLVRGWEGRNLHKTLPSPTPTTRRSGYSAGTGPQDDTPSSPSQGQEAQSYFSFSKRLQGKLQ